MAVLALSLPLETTEAELLIPVLPEACAVAIDREGAHAEFEGLLVWGMNFVRVSITVLEELKLTAALANAVSAVLLEPVATFARGAVAAVGAARLSEARPAPAGSAAAAAAAPFISVVGVGAVEAMIVDELVVAVVVVLPAVSALAVHEEL
mmetsp:Transcript_21758/g.43170  ORF Transcript_21758/g.43170 Transcript_21758/m.43170 type:complete len:151 (+) Transcript_21758:2325-2777(+)